MKYKELVKALPCSKDILDADVLINGMPVKGVNIVCCTEEVQLTFIEEKNENTGGFGCAGGVCEIDFNTPSDEKE